MWFDRRRYGWCRTCWLLIEAAPFDPDSDSCQYVLIRAHNAEKSDVAALFGAAKDWDTPFVTLEMVNKLCQVFGKVKDEGEALFKVSNVDEPSSVPAVLTVKAASATHQMTWNAGAA